MGKWRLKITQKCALDLIFSQDKKHVKSDICMANNAFNMDFLDGYLTNICGLMVKKHVWYTTLRARYGQI